jgi:hypothetical protein
LYCDAHHHRHCAPTSVATLAATAGGLHWNEDTEPPVIDMPEEAIWAAILPMIPDCTTIAHRSTDNCPHEPPTVDCQIEEPPDGCIVTRIMHRHGDRQVWQPPRLSAGGLHWNEDTEPPVIDPPDGGDLGCNPCA